MGPLERLESLTHSNAGTARDERDRQDIRWILDERRRLLAVIEAAGLTPELRVEGP
jgi:hypothetical protein